MNSDSELVTTLERVEAAYQKVTITSIDYHRHILKKNFGFDDFRDFQLKIIQSIIFKKCDNLVIMSSGKGKSLCYQYPSLWTGGLSIVVSPFMSSMRDEVAKLNKQNIPATYLGPENIDSDRICDALVNSNFYRIVYVCPRYITQNKNLLKKLEQKLTLIAIEEAQCVSHWSVKFREDYELLGGLRKIVPHVPIIALTSIATKCMQKEIETSLCLQNPQLTCTGFDKPNLEFLVQPLNQFSSIIRTMARTVKGSIIVYCPYRSDCEEIVESLKKDKFNCECYHAGLGKTKRSAIETKFRNNELRLIIATSAFGIDKPDVRCVIHYRAVESLERFYQEIGHAGHDGKHCKSIFFFDKIDLATYLPAMQDHETTSPYFRRIKKLLRSYLEQYLISDRCRRLNILQYFEGLSVKCQPRKNCCDNCSSGKSSQYSYQYPNMDDRGFFDFTFDSRILMNLINSIPNGILRSNLNPQKQQNLINRNVDYWDGLIDVLERLRYVKANYDEIAWQPEAIKLDSLGVNWISAKQSMKFQLQPFDKLTRYMELKSPKKQNSKQLLTSNTLVKSNAATKSVRSMILLLKENPYPTETEVTNITYVHRNVMDLINRKWSIPHIEQHLSLSRSTSTAFVSTLLQHGYLVTKMDLERLYGLFENVFHSILMKLPQNIFSSGVIRSVKSELPGVSCDQIRLVLSYRYPRVYLKQLGLKFDDPDEIPSSAQFVPTTHPNIPCRSDSFTNLLLDEFVNYFNPEHTDVLSSSHEVDETENAAEEEDNEMNEKELDSSEVDTEDDPDEIPSSAQFVPTTHPNIPCRSDSFSNLLLDEFVDYIDPEHTDVLSSNQKVDETENAAEEEDTEVEDNEVKEKESDSSEFDSEIETEYYTEYDTEDDTVYNTENDTEDDTVYNTENDTVYNTENDTVYNTEDDTEDDTVYNTENDTVYNTEDDTVYNTENDTEDDTVYNTENDTENDTVYNTEDDTVYDTEYDTEDYTVYDTQIEDNEVENTEGDEPDLKETHVYEIEGDVDESNSTDELFSQVTQENSSDCNACSILGWDDFIVCQKRRHNNAGEDNMLQKRKKKI